MEDSILNHPNHRLSLEQEFALRQLSDQVRKLTHEQIQDLVIDLSRQALIKDNLYKELLRSGL